MLVDMSIPDPDVILEDVPENFEKYRENWRATYEDKFRSVMQKANSDTFSLIVQLSPVDEDSTNSLFEDILRNRKQSALLYTIYRFISGKKLSVRDLADKKGETIGRGEEYAYVLKKIANGDHDFLYKLNLYNDWTASSDVFAYAVEDRVPEDYMQILEDEFSAIKYTLARKTRSSFYTHDERDRIEIQDGHLLNIDRQTSDQAKRDWSGRQRRRNISNVFVEIDEGRDRIRIATSNTNIRETLRDKLQDVLDVFLYDLETDVSKADIDKSKFESELSDDSESSARILAAEFERSNVSPALPIKISKKSYNRDVRPIIKSMEPEIITVELDNVSKLWAEVEGQEGTINFEQSLQQGFFRLDSNVDSQREHFQQIFRERFSEIFGVPVDKKIPLHWVTGDRESFIASILKNPSEYDSRRFPNQDLTEELEGLGIIDRRTVIQKKCIDCGKKDHRSLQECQSCGGNLQEVARYRVPRTSKPGIREFIKKILDREGIDYLSKHTEKIFRTEYEFLRVRVRGKEVDIHLNTTDVNLTEKAVEHLQKSLNPVLVVNPGEVKNMHLMDEGLTSTLDLAELVDLELAGDLPNDYIRTELETVARSTEELASSNARTAFENMTDMVSKPDSTDSIQFEQEIFHIFNQIVPNTQQWGSKRQGNVPDGFSELIFDTQQGTYFRSFTYDSKFTEDSDLKLDTDETRRLRGYVHRIINSEEFKSTKSELGQFIVITNAGDGGMNVVAERLNKMDKWDGYPVFMHASFPMALHVVYNENVELIRNNVDEFYEQLYRTLNGGNLYQTEQDDVEFYVSLSDEDVESLMDNFSANISDSGLQIDELREFLESDIFP